MHTCSRNAVLHRIYLLFLLIALAACSPPVRSEMPASPSSAGAERTTVPLEPSASDAVMPEAEVVATRNEPRPTATDVTVSPSPTRAPTTASSLPTAMVTPAATPINRESIPTELQAAFVTRCDEESQQLWVLTSPFAEPYLAATFPQERALVNSTVAWSSQGDRIAFTQRIGEQAMTVAILNVDTGQAHQFDYQVPTQPDANWSTTLTVFQGSWSLDDQWLAVLQNTIPAASRQALSTALINTDTGEVVELDESKEFEGWSPVMPDEYLYILHPDYPRMGNETVNVGEIGSTEPVLTIADFGVFAPSLAHFVWSPDGSKLVMNTRGPANRPTNLLIDLPARNWVNTDLGGDHFPVAWSPDGEWIAFSNGGLYFSRVEDEGDSVVHVNSESGSLIPAGWLEQEQRFVAYDRASIYLIEPAPPEQPLHSFLDLRAITATTECSAIEGIAVWP